MTEQGNGRTETAVIRLANHLGELDRLHAFFEEIGLRTSWPDKLKWELTLACEELLTNTINYGFPQGGRHLITLGVSAEQGLVEVSLEDEGIPFNPLEQEAPDLSLDIEERAIGGLGIFFVKQTMDEIYYERTDSVNRVILRKTV
ncbi:ATP-binding protein [Cohnella cholangitidis]|uniref:ATP-binding protein n=1 Tax=Cohnella cholangitidis TaxID=2598458 RepID=UPI0015FA0C12|nr:ATP-binding protein [Cohnella cholangitidis]